LHGVVFSFLSFKKSAKQNAEEKSQGPARSIEQLAISALAHWATTGILTGFSGQKELGLLLRYTPQNDTLR
jgi:hypothetical protein